MVLSTPALPCCVSAKELEELALKCLKKSLKWIINSNSRSDQVIDNLPDLLTPRLLLEIKKKKETLPQGDHRTWDGGDFPFFFLLPFSLSPQGSSRFGERSIAIGASLSASPQELPNIIIPTGSLNWLACTCRCRHPLPLMLGCHRYWRQTASSLAIQIDGLPCTSIMLLYRLSRLYQMKLFPSANLCHYWSTLSNLPCMYILFVPQLK